MNSDKVIDFESFTKLAQRVKHYVDDCMQDKQIDERELIIMLEEVLNISVEE